MPTVPITRPSPDDPVPPDAPATVPPDERPVDGPAGPRTPYPVNDPGIADPDRQPGSAPDVIPGRPGGMPSL